MAASPPPMPQWQGPPAEHTHLRVGDDDREQVVEHVKSAYAEGRYDKIEFDERMHRAMTAQTHADLVPIMTEIYGPQSAHAPSYPRRGRAKAGPYPRADSSSDRVVAGVGHLLPLVGFPLIGPLIVLLAAGKTSPYVRSHAIEAINFHLTVVGASILLGITLVGIMLLPVVWLGACVLSIVGGAAAMSESSFRYPLTLRMVKD